MAKKQFIRHLEFYGFPDQNGYASEVNVIDLSDIREKNKEQDKEIKDLENEKATKKDLLALSGTVENLITVQGEINKGFADAISGLTDDVNTLKEIDNEFAEQLSAITDVIEDVSGELDELGERVDVLEDTVSGLTDDLEAFKDDVYTKEEIDEMISSGISGYATQQWVIEQGYITSGEADDKYATIEDLQELASAVESAATNIDVEINEITNVLNEFSSITENQITEINQTINNFSGEVANQIENIYHEIDDANDKISANTEAIVELKDAVSANTDSINELAETKADKTDLEYVSGAVDDLATEVAKKADRSEVDHQIEVLQSQIDTKAEKADLDFVSGAVSDINDRLEAEITRSTNKDTEHDSKIQSLSGDVADLTTLVNSYEDRVTNLETGLTKEIADREQADIELKEDLIGTEGDSLTLDTIWGAKNFAKEEGRKAISSAITYVDDKYTEFNTALLNLSAATDQKLTAKADKDYVDGRISDIQTDYESKIANAVELEEEDRKAADDALAERLSDFEEQFTKPDGVFDEIDKHGTILNAFTAWDGEGEYDDSGNGIVDVMHREIHELNPQAIEALSATVETMKSEKFDDAVYNENAKEIQFKANGSVVASIDATPFIKDGMIDEVKIENGKLIIVFNTDSGKETIEIPLSEIFNPDNYYTKNDIDTKLATKFDDVSYNGTTQKIEFFADGTKVDEVEVSTFNPDNYYTKDDVDTKLALKANAADVYTKNDVDTKLALKANSADVTTALATKADADSVYTKNEVDTKLAEKADIVHQHALADIDGIEEFGDTGLIVIEGTETIDLVAGEF